MTMSNERAVRLAWMGERLRFEGGGTQPHTPAIVVDGDGELGPSPMITLLLAAAGCSGSDVVLILKKMRVDLQSLSIEVTGTRREKEPRRYMAIRFRFLMAGTGLDRSKAERAVQLSVEKYCSVLATLAPDVTVEHEVVLA